ncbi:MAG: HAMP domain-containing protein [Acidobacteria bacterium]|nr:HAMP domain-containing protein [Acidobacteriota bacterium]
MKLSEKLAALCALVAAVPLMIAALIAFSALAANARQQALEQLRKDSRAVASLYDKRLDTMRVAAQQIAVDISNKALVSSEAADGSSNTAWARLQDMLPRAQNEFNLDFLIVADPTGRVIARHNDKPAAGETLISFNDKNLLVEKVIADANLLRNPAQAAAVVEHRDHLAKLGLENLAQVRLGHEVKVSDALMLEASAAIFSAGRFVGVILIGQMLNNYAVARPGASPLQTPLVAEARQVLQGSMNQESAAAIPFGAAIALGDTIIASSILLPGTGEKAALSGALVTPTDTPNLIQESNRHFAIAWQPIKSFEGLPVGAIGAAISADGINGASASLKWSLWLLTLLACLLAGAAGYLFGRNLSARINTLTDAASRMSLGELSAPVRDESLPEKRLLPEFLLKDEITTLTNKLDDMRESFRQAIERLKKR